MNWNDIWSWPGWAAIGAVGQFIEAAVVLGSVSLILTQLRDIEGGAEERKWEALRWALELVSLRDLVAFLLMSEDSDRSENSEYAELVTTIMPMLHLTYLAIDDGHVDRDLYMASRAGILRALLMVTDKIMSAEPALSWMYESAIPLMEDAAKWLVEHDRGDVGYFGVATTR